MTNTTSDRFALLVPVKPPARAKSRLAPLGDETRQALVAAFAADTVSAALECVAVEAVLVVTDDHLLAESLRGPGVEVVPDGVVDDLNASLVQAAAEAQRRWPGLRLAAICADLPALDPDELAEALQAASCHRSAFVADAAGVGTTMVVAASREHFRPHFGDASREAHLAAGAHEVVEVAVPTLRHDVDTPADLDAALAIGVGNHTTEVAEGLSL